MLDIRVCHKLTLLAYKCKRAWHAEELSESGMPSSDMILYGLWSNGDDWPHDPYN